MVRGLFVHALLAFALGLFSGNAALANPTGAGIARGQVTFSNPNLNTLNIRNSPGAIVNWQKFSIQNGQTTRFIQNSAASAILNRVTGQNPSVLLGRLLSNGRVFLINRNGIVFGPNAVIDTAGLVASTLNITDQDFINQNLRFQGDRQSGSIENQGYIKAGANGNIFLIAPNITNSGIIETDGGQLVLAAGESVSLVSLDSDNIVFDVQAPDNEVVNLGTLLTHGGAARMFAGTITHGGSINADSVSVDEQGQIQLLALADVNIETTSTISANGPVGGKVEIESTDGTARVSGHIEAKGDGQHGGSLHILAARVALLDEAHLDVSGETGGGEALIGGDYQGSNPGIHNAAQTHISEGTTIRADAISNGNGGKVIVWADNTTVYHGSISARGGGNSGAGGFVEISGKRTLEFAGHVDLSAPAGEFGTLLLDPKDITVTSGPGGAAGDLLFTDTPGTNSSITNGSVNAALALGNLTLEANNDFLLSTGADITVSAAGSGGNLTIRAGRSIVFNADISTDGGNFTATANSSVADGVVNAQRDPGAAVIQFADNSTITTAGGNALIQLQDGAGLTNSTAGDITIGTDGAGVNTGSGSINVENYNAGQGLVMQSGTGPGILTNDNSFISILVETIDLQGVGVTHINSATGGNGGDVFISPVFTGTTVGLAGGAGGLNLSANELDAINLTGTTSGTLTIGDLSGADIQIGAYTAPAGTQTWSLLTGGSFEVITGLNSSGTLNLSIRVDGVNNSAESLNIANVTAASLIMSGGTDGNDTLIAGNVANTWNLTGADSGTLNGDAFANFANLTGNANDDAFVFAAGGSISGLVDGVIGGTDNLDYSALNSPALFVNIASGTASQVGAFTNITNLIGGSSTDQLIGPDVANTWNITATNAGTVAGFSFSGYELLEGGAGSNNFVLADGVTVTQINGASTPLGNTLDMSAYTTALTFAQNSTNSLTVNGINVVNVGNYTGGSGDDTFVLDANIAATFSGTLDGGPGADHFDGSGRSAIYSYDLATNKITGAGAISFPVVNVEKFTAPVMPGAFDNIRGSASAEIFTVNSDNSVSINGITFFDFDVIDGRDGNDIFNLFGAVSIGGGNGADTVNLLADISPSAGTFIFSSSNVETTNNTGAFTITTNSLQIINATTFGSLANPVLTNVSEIVVSDNDGTGSIFISEANLVNLRTINAPTSFWLSTPGNITNTVGDSLTSNSVTLSGADIGTGGAPIQLQAAAISLTSNGGMFVYNLGNTIVTTLTNTGGAGDLVFNNTAGLLTLAGSLVTNVPGNLTINSTAGLVSAAGRSFIVGGDAALDSGANLFFFDGTALNANNISLSGSLITLQAGSQILSIVAGGTLSITTPNTLSVTGSDTTPSQQATLQSTGALTIDAGAVTVRGGSQNDASAVIRTLAGAQTLTLGSGVLTILAGAGSVSHALLQSGGGDVSVSADAIFIDTAGAGVDSDAAIIADGGAGNANLTFLSTCTGCNPVADPTALPGSQFGIWAAAINLLAAIVFDNSQGDFLWNVPLNWNIDALPGLGDVVSINLGGGFTIVLDSGTHAIGSLFSDESLSFTGGSLTISNDATVNGAVTVAGGTLNLNGLANSVMDLNVDSGTLAVNTAGGVLDITNSLSWLAGNISGAGGVNLNTGAVGNIDSAGGRILFGKFVNNGTLNVLTGATVATSLSGAQFTNNSQLNMDGNGWGFSGTGSIVNSAGATITRTGATGFSLLNASGNISNSGTVIVQDGSFSMQSGGSHTGATIIVNGGTLSLHGGHTLDAGTSVTGAGVVSMSGGGTNIIDGIYNIAGGTSVGATDVIFNTDAVFGNSLSLGPSGVITLNGASNSTNSLSIGAGGGAATVTLTLGGDLAVASNFFWNKNATINGVGTLDASSVTANSSNVNARILDGATVLLGAMNLTGGSLDIKSGRLDLAGASSTSAGTTLTLSGGTLSGAGTLTIGGLFNWTAGTQSGGGPGIWGTTLIDSGATLSINGASAKALQDFRRLENRGTVNWSGTAVLTTTNGADIINAAGAVFDIQDDVQTNFSGGAGSFFTNSGTLLRSAGSGTARLTSVFDNTATGLVQVDSGILLINSNVSNAGSIVNTAQFEVAGAQTFTNTAPGILAGTGTYVTPAAGLVNDGIIRPGASPGTMAITGDITFTSGSQLDVELAPALVSDVLAVTGNVTIDPGASLNILEFGSDTGIGGDDFTVITATGTLNGSFDILNQAPGFNVSPTYTTGAPGDLLLTVAGLINSWIAGTGFWNIGANWSDGVFPLAGEFAEIDNGGVQVTIPAGFAAAVGDLTLVDLLIIDGGTLNVTGTTTVGPGATLKLSSGGMSSGGMFANSGSVNLITGTLSATGGYTQTAGLTRVNSSLDVTAAGLNLNGGTLMGDGTILGNVTNSAGIVRAGNSPGTLTISGDYIQASGGSLNVELGGPPAGANSSLLSVGGDAILDGNLNLSLIPGFTGSVGDVINIIETGNTVSGDFAIINAPGTHTFSGTPGIALVPGPGEAYQLGFLTVPEIIIINPANSSTDQSTDLTMALVDNLEKVLAEFGELQGEDEEDEGEGKRMLICR